MINIVTVKWVLIWLSNRDRRNLVAISNPMTLTAGFIERNKSDGVMFRIRELRNNPKISKIYEQLNKQDNNLSPMVQDWVSHAISQNR
jgi:hypothetical protein